MRFSKRIRVRIFWISCEIQIQTGVHFLFLIFARWCENAKRVQSAIFLDFDIFSCFFYLFPLIFYIILRKMYIIISNKWKTTNFSFVDLNSYPSTQTSMNLWPCLWLMNSPSLCFCVIKWFFSSCFFLFSVSNSNLQINCWLFCVVAFF